ncbi:hypothetical protein OS493_015332 [Desmophyllum pertusum]|uniref:Translation initiation factor 3 N-terminal domain-containing protein n=1 Tax=Desmophyllum pertusum TaxID=174260 RepID=A0A9W9ZDZ7_9CNID|nr:hypothetical protein OS493_015332 [Desmophyllum pertusum]
MAAGRLCWMLNPWFYKSMMSCYHDYKTVESLCSFILLRRLFIQGKIYGVNHLQPSRTIVLFSSRNEQESSKRERRQKSVLLVDETGCSQGEMSLGEALRIAERKSLKLVWVNEKDKTAVPVYKMMSKFDIKIKARSNKPPKTKSIEVTDKIESRDLSFRVKHIQQHLEKGHQVKLYVKTKGRRNEETRSEGN